MADAAHEAYELVEDGLMSAADFRAMVFTNAVKFWTSTNPTFFKEPLLKMPSGGYCLPNLKSDNAGEATKEEDVECLRLRM